jgi:Lrp/AsnC family transcriptional regulator, regulator for asnA, asnC and gidA
VTEIRLDALDRRIIEELGRDARVSNRQIATDLGVAEATIRARLRRLQSEHLMVGSPTLVIFGIHADPARVPKLADELARMREINCVMVLLGRFSLLATGLFTSMTEVEETSRQSILPLKGVRRIETIVSIQQFKYDFRMARIVARGKHGSLAKESSRHSRPS